MPDIALDLSDAIELAELLSFINQWITGTEAAALAASFTRFVGHPGYNPTTLSNDLQRFVFLLGASDGEDLFGERHQ